MKVPQEVVSANVRAALEEDLGTGDLHAVLVESSKFSTAHVITRSPGILCGQDWVNETLRQSSDQITSMWHLEDGASLSRNDKILTLNGPCHILLRVERTMLNFLQLLSGTATRVHEFATFIQHTSARILDTRKTLPGLRYAQKYAVLVGGGSNHRFGLFDAFLIKENHILSAGGITTALQRARKGHPNRFLEIEVENVSELREALQGLPDRIMLDNFSIPQLKEAIQIARDFDRVHDKHTELEASGQINLSNIVEVAETGIDCISLGTLTKDVSALDFSMRIQE